MQALWGEPWTTRSVFRRWKRSRALSRALRFRRWKRSRALSRRCHRSLATCQTMHGDAVKACKARSRDDEMAVPPRVLSSSSVSTLRIRFLALVVFSVLSCTFSEHCRKKSVDQRPSKSKAEIRIPIVDFLCVKVLRRVKKDRTPVKKIEIEFVSKGS